MLPWWSTLGRHKLIPTNPIMPGLRSHLNTHPRSHRVTTPLPKPRMARCFSLVNRFMTETPQLSPVSPPR